MITMNDLDNFKKTKEFLVCVDSDGCAMDTMDIKHIRCFGPVMVEQWRLQKWKKQILERWNEINLYSMTRGINRFKGLAIALEEISENNQPIEGIKELKEWTQHASELSNSALEQKIAEGSNPVFQEALMWSRKVNEAINMLTEDEKRPFEHVKEGLEAAHKFSDVAVVSSANREAVEEEWNRCGLTEHVDILCCQDSGSKAHCLEVLLKKGYDPTHVLMVGDAPGDREAAKQNGVQYYPILVRREKESWKELKEKGLELLVSEKYQEYGQIKEIEFLQNLGG